MLDLDEVVVFAYTRAMALADGVLIDVTPQAKLVGFTVHTVVTATLWESIIHTVEITADVLDKKLNAFLSRCYAEATKAVMRQPNLPRVNFFYRDLESPENAEHEVIVDVGPGDDGQSVLTIMFPCDD